MSTGRKSQARSPTAPRRVPMDPEPKGEAVIRPGRGFWPRGMTASTSSVGNPQPCADNSLSQHGRVVPALLALLGPRRMGTTSEDVAIKGADVRRFVAAEDAHEGV